MSSKMRRHTPSPSNIQALPIDHPENFPVASWLCPPRLRPAIAAIYAFARAAAPMRQVIGPISLGPFIR
jgi:phytoene/squalene synthetase